MEALITILFSFAYVVLLVREYWPRIVYYDMTQSMPVYVERHHFNVIDLKYQFMYNEFDLYTMPEEYRSKHLKNSAFRAFVQQLEEMPGAIVWHERTFKEDPYMRYGEHLITARAKIVQIDDTELFNKVYGNETTGNGYPQNYPGPSDANTGVGNRSRESEVRKYPTKDSKPARPKANRRKPAGPGKGKGA